MKSINVLAMALSLAFCVSVSAVQSDAQLIRNRQRVIADWNNVLTILKRAVPTENDASYKRVNKALKTNGAHVKYLTSNHSSKAAAGERVSRN